jgi:hypothetical protein
MAKLSDLSQATVDKAQDLRDKTANVAKATYSNVQDSVETGRGKMQAAIVAGLALAEGLTRYNARQNEKNVKNIRRANRRANKKAVKQAKKNLANVQDTVVDAVKPRLAATQDALQSGFSSAQEALQSGLVSAQDVLQTSLENAQETFAKNSKKAQKNLKKAQKDLQKLQGSVQDTVSDKVGTGLAITQDALKKSSQALSKGSQEASKKLAATAATAQELRDSVQEQIQNYQRKRARARALFRWGLVFGVVLALLFTPYPGADVRRSLMAQWERYRSYFGM